MQNNTIRLLLTLMLAAPVFPAYTQQLGRTADKTNFTQSRKIADQPNLKWAFRTGGQVYSSPVVTGNLVITGSCDSTLYALDKHTGAPVWKFRSGGEIRSAIAADEQLVFFSCSDGMFYALERASGKLKWKFRTLGEKQYDTWDYFLSSPTLYHGNIYFGSGDGYLYTLNSQTGNLVWRFKTNGIVHASPVVKDDAVLVGSFDGVFYCINTDGSLRWKFNTIGEKYFTKGEVQFNAVTSDSTVFFCARDYNLYALNIRTGNGHWLYHQPGSWTSVPSMAGSTLIVTMSDSRNILAFDKTDGTKIRDTPVPLNIFSSASINDSMAYFGCLDGILYQYDLRNGKLSSIFQTPSSRMHYSRFFSPAGKLDNRLLEKYHGDFIAMFKDFIKLGSILSTVWIDDGVLYFASTDGYIYAIG